MVETKPKTAVVTAADRLLDLDGDGMLNAVERGEVLVLRTIEPPTGSANENHFAITAKLRALDDTVAINNDLELSGKLHKGSELPGSVEWTTTDNDVPNVNVVSINGTKTFETTYGTFYGHDDGRYSFVVRPDAETLEWDTLDNELVFSYNFTDQDGDTASNKVVINLRDYMQTSTAVVKDHSGETDINATSYVLVGTSADGDVLRGGAGDDVLEGLAGEDTLDGGAGNDYFLPSFITDANGNILEDTIIGGAGFDAVMLNPQPYIDDQGGVKMNGNFSTESFVNRVSGIEQLDMANGIGDQTLTIKASDVLSISENGELFIKGDATDKVDISDYSRQAAPDAAHTKAGFATYYDATTGTYLYIDNNIVNSGNVI